MKFPRFNTAKKGAVEPQQAYNAKPEAFWLHGRKATS